MTLSANFLRAYPDAYIREDGYIVVRETKGSVYHPTLNFLIRGWVGFKSEDDEREQIIYSIYPCNTAINEHGEWVASDRTPTYTNIVSTDEYNRMIKECFDNGFRILKVDASTNRDLITTDTPNADLQPNLDRIALERTLNC